MLHNIIQLKLLICIFLQGPAVYAFNNAKFTAEDWDGIQKPARSVKKEDVLKVGRFGIGFSSVYHLTGIRTKPLCVIYTVH